MGGYLMTIMIPHEELIRFYMISTFTGQIVPTEDEGCRRNAQASRRQHGGQHFGRALMRTKDKRWFCLLKHSPVMVNFRQLQHDVGLPLIQPMNAGLRRRRAPHQPSCSLNGLPAPGTFDRLAQIVSHRNRSCPLHVCIRQCVPQSHRKRSFAIGNQPLPLQFCAEIVLICGQQTVWNRMQHLAIGCLTGLFEESA